MKSWLFLLVLFILPFDSSSQLLDDTWVEGEGVILEIRTRTNHKGTRSFGKVTHIATDGKSYESEIELPSIPLYGTYKRVGDKVKIYYDPAQPFFAKSESSTFIEKYGWYLLILAGVISSVYSLKKVYSKKPEA